MLVSPVLNKNIVAGSGTADGARPAFPKLKLSILKANEPFIVVEKLNEVIGTFEVKPKKTGETTYPVLLLPTGPVSTTVCCVPLESRHGNRGNCAVP